MENGLKGVRGRDAGVPSVCSHLKHLLMKIEYQFASIFASIEVQTFPEDSSSCCTINLVPTDTVSVFYIEVVPCNGVTFIFYIKNNITLVSVRD